MSKMLKCPNPSCPYVFDPSQVPVGVVLSCPRCGMQFTLGAPAAPPQAPTAPAAPPGYPSQTEGDSDFEAIGRTADEERDPDELLPPRGSSKATLFIFAGIAAVFMASTVLILVFLYLRRDGSPGDQPEAMTRIGEFNVAMQGAPPDWKSDDDTRVNLGTPFVLAHRREKPEAYAAFGAWEPKEKGRAPRPSEMRRDVTAPLRKLFDPSTVREEPFPDAQWLGQDIRPGHAFKFRAQSRDGLVWVGETCTVSHKGIAYFWLNWCKESDYEGLKGEFAAFRAKFKLLELRKDWQETVSNVVHFKGDTVPYTISDAEELWKEVPQQELKMLQELQPDLDKRLRIRLTPRRDRRALPAEGELSVYLLGSGATGELSQVARKFAEDRETARIRAANPDLTPPTFRELTDPPQGDPVPNTVPATTPVVRLLSEVKESASAARLIVVSAIKVGDKTVVVHCWCEAARRDTFETKFVQIASSLR